MAEAIIVPTVEVPKTPEEWAAAGERAYHEFISAIQRFGVEPDPRLKLVTGVLQNPYYEPETWSIALGMADVRTLQGRLYWLMAMRLYGLESVDQTMAALAATLPWVVAHETAHHLRHAYGAPNENDFIEEQVCNLIAIAFIREHPVYRDRLPLMRSLAERATKALRELAPDAVQRLPGFRLNLIDTLVANGTLAPERASDLEVLARAVGISGEEILRISQIVPDEGIENASAFRSTTEVYFNRRYTSSLYEYFLFGNDWLRTHLEREDLPSLGECLQQYILTPDWEKARQIEVERFLLATISHPVPAAALAAAEALLATPEVDRRSNAIDAILNADGERSLFLMPALARAAVGDARTAALARKGLRSSDRQIKAISAAILIEHGFPEETDEAQAALQELLDEREDLAGIASGLACVAPERFRSVILAALGSSQGADRAEALRILRTFPHEPAIGVLAAAALEDQDDEVRLAALECVDKHYIDAIAPQLRLLAMNRSLVLRQRALQMLKRTDQPSPFAVPEAGWEAQTHVIAALVGPEERPSAALEALGRVSGALAIVQGVLCTGARLTQKERFLYDVLVTEAKRLQATMLRLRAIHDEDPRYDIAHAAFLEGGQAWRVASELLSAYAPAELQQCLEYLPPASRAPRAPRKQALTSLLEYPNKVLATLAAEILADDEDCTRLGSPTHMLTRTEKLIFLRSLDLFATTPIEDLNLLVDACFTQFYAAGEWVFRTGEAGESLHVITRGSVSVLQERDTQLMQIAQLSAGQCFGEMALFDNSRRSASIRAEDDLTVLSLQRDRFYRTARMHPEILINVISVLTSRLRSTTQALAEARDHVP